jgi:hypothetical protein
MVADEKKGVHRLRVDRSRTPPRLTYDKPLSLDPPTKQFLRDHGLEKSDLKELDLEAIAETGEKGALKGKVIFVGSHANKRNTGEPNPGAHLIAISDTQTLRSQTQTKIPVEWASLDKLFQMFFAGALYQKLQRGGINVEGATVYDDKLWIGLRSPTRLTAKPAAYVLSTPLKGLLKEDFSDAKRYVLPTSEPMIGIRSMETVGDLILLVTGDAGVNDLPLPRGTVAARGRKLAPQDWNINEENEKRPFQLRAWKPGDEEMHSRVLAVFPKKQAKKFDSHETSRAKVEGIAAASENGKDVALFVVYDGSDKVFYLPDVKLP